MYPLAEAEVVSGFEAEAAGRRVSFQLQSRRRSQAACCRALGPGLGTPTPRRCAQGESDAPAPALLKARRSSGSRTRSAYARPPPSSRRCLVHSLAHPRIQQSWAGHLTCARCWENMTLRFTARETDIAGSTGLAGAPAALTAQEMGLSRGLQREPSPQLVPSAPLLF